jgi:hypothetical protein
VAQAAATAAGFATAWTRSDLPANGWWAGVSPLCEAGFAAKLRTVDPANVPATKVTGPPVTASNPGEGVVVYTVPTDGGMLSVTVAVIGGRWQVTGNNFGRTAR